jgi:hypothetical protein
MLQYKTPHHKIVGWFLKSRNDWKRKCLEAKYELKKANQRALYLKETVVELRNRINEVEKKAQKSDQRETK